MNQSFARAVVLTLLASFLAVSFSSCGPIQRQRHFKRSIVYFSRTPIAQHRPTDGARASWHLISHPDSSIPYLLDRIESEDIAEAGTAIILLQAVAGNQHREKLLSAIEARDWSKAPGSLSDYVDLATSLLRENKKGVAEK